MSKTDVRIVRIYPDILGTYGDNGNAIVLQKRLEWRGINSSIVDVTLNDSIPATGDIYLIGGGEDAAESAACESLKSSKTFAKIFERGASILAVCAGFQILGTEYEDALGKMRPGLGLIDATTKGESPRLVGDVVIDTANSINVGMLVGYENHAGNTVLGKTQQAFGSIVKGYGNSKNADTDGAIAGGLIGTYLHGPVLARNPRFADYMLSGIVGDLEPLEADILHQVWSERMAAAGLAKATA
jgi:CobQ-like glutamine amidotransferase family enzyme